MRSLTKLGSVVVAVSLAVLLLGGCAPEEEEEVGKPEYVQVAFNGAISGAYAMMYTGIAPAYAAAADYINIEFGGLDGVPWRFVVMDSALKAEVGVANFMRALEMKPEVLGMTISDSTLSDALRTLAVENKFPLLVPGSPANVYPGGYSFANYILYSDAFGHFMDWLVETGQGDKKLGILTWDITFGRSILISECLDYAEEKGIDIVGTEVFAFADIDVTTQLSKLDALGAEWIFGCVTGNGTAVVMRGIKELGLGDKGVQFCGPHCGTAEPNNIAIDPEAFEGCYKVAHHWSTDDWREPNPHPGMLMIHDYWERFASPVASWGSTPVAQGWISNLIWYEAFERVIDEYGWEGLNGKHIKEALETFDHVSFLDDIAQMTFSPTRLSSTTAMMMKVVNGRVVHIEDEWMEVPDLRGAEFEEFR